MPIGKDSIRKRVIGSDSTASGAGAKKKPVPEEAMANEPGLEVIVPTTKAPARRPGRPRKTTTPLEKSPIAEAPAVTETVLANVSPEVVAKVIGHEENAGTEHVQITDKMPHYLL